MPFRQQHPVRGFFGDPRIGKPLGGSSFYNGIDISAAAGTAVYAVAPGTIDFGDGPTNPSVVWPDRGGDHSYWHVEPAPLLKQGDTVTQGQLLGHILMPGPGENWQHVHFAERTSDGKYWNPFREGALTPFAKSSAPSVDLIAAFRGGQRVAPNATTGALELTGIVELVAEAHDVTPIPPLPPYQHMPVAPAYVCWRLVANARIVVPWTPVADFRTSLTLKVFTTTEVNEAYGVQIGATSDLGWENIYAPGTRQNNIANADSPAPVPEPGLYRFKLAGAFNTNAHPDGSYRLDVEVTDIRGNASTGHLSVVIANGT